MSSKSQELVVVTGASSGIGRATAKRLRSAADHPDLQILINNAGVQNNVSFDEDASTPQTIRDEVNG